MISVPSLVFNDILDFLLIFVGAIFEWSHTVFVLFNEALFCLETFDVGVGELRHDVFLDLVNFFNFHAFELHQMIGTSDYRLRYSSCVQLLFLNCSHFLRRKFFLSRRILEQPLSRLRNMMRKSGYLFALLRISAKSCVKMSVLYPVWMARGWCWWPWSRVTILLRCFLLISFMSYQKTRFCFWGVLFSCLSCQSTMPFWRRQLPSELFWGPMLWSGYFLFCKFITRLFRIWVFAFWSTALCCQLLRDHNI